MLDMENQMVLPDVRDWCTIDWAAERIGCHKRTILRLLAEGTLGRYSPRTGKGHRGPVLLHSAEVERYAIAKSVVAGRA